MDVIPGVMGSHGELQTEEGATDLLFRGSH